MSAPRRMLSLTLYKSAGYALLSTDDRKSWRMDGAQVRSAPGHAGPFDPAHPLGGPDARMGHLPADPAALERRAAGEPGIALPRAAPARAAGPDRSGMGQLGQQPEGEVLSAHARRTEAAPGGTAQLGAPLHRGRART